MGRTAASTAAALVLAGMFVATSAPAADELPVDQIVVTADRRERDLGSTTAALSVVNRSAIEDGRATVGLDESLSRVPGLFVQNAGNHAQDLRLQIRGFGTRAAFGIREIKVLVDGLPETLPDGQTQIDSIELGAIERIEVLRRPAATLYGNASGGVIQMFTADGPDAPWVDVRALGGSFGLRKYQLRGGGRHEDWKLVAHVSRFETDGHRDHGAAQSTIGGIKLRRRIGADSDVTLLVDAVDAPIAEDPGGLTRAEADADRGAARDLNVALDAGEEVRQARAGVVVRHTGWFGRVRAHAYALWRDFENRLPVRPEQGAGIVTFDRVSPGAGVQLERGFSLFSLEHDLLVGVDVQHQDDDRQRFANVGGARGERLLDQRERVTGMGTYLQATTHVGDALELFAGARFDSIRFDVDVDFDATGDSPSGERTLEAWSPVGGAQYRAAPWLSLFASVSTAFQTPTTTELANPDGGGFDPDLEPQTSLAGELGLRIDRGDLRLGLTGYVMRVEDQILRFESPSGRDAFRNAGRSRRAGAEADWRWRAGRGLTWTGALTWISTEFRDYATDAGDFAGNEEPGIPSWQVFQELRWDHASGGFVAGELFAVDDLYVDDANRVRSEGYVLMNVRAGWEIERGRWRLSPFVGLTNLFDEDYDGTVRLNAFGGRFFEPGPGRAFVAGLGVAYRL